MRKRLLLLGVVALVSMWACSNDLSSPTATGCTYVVTPSVLAVGANGGTSTVTVTTGSSCPWTTTTNSAFINVTGGATGTGSVTLTVAANPAASTGGGVRSGTVTVAGQTVTVNQGDH
jgi:hypothetical protein